ncbi:hypothetical protein CLU79DRAFT_835260 [Phycomyces nitens]|nr:hypothetical protein CLU79DRAFT_835260 [Phycomyces nitens]
MDTVTPQYPFSLAQVQTSSNQDLITRSARQRPSQQQPPEPFQRLDQPDHNVLTGPRNKDLSGPIHTITISSKSRPQTRKEVDKNHLHIYLLFTIYAKSRTRNQTARWDVVSTSEEIDKPARLSLPTEKYHERSGHSSISMKLQKLPNQPLLPAASDWLQGQQTDDASTW